jgi:tetratricopeptide (TPR) repeat protein
MEIFFIVLFLQGLVFGAFCSYIASQKNKNIGAWFVFGFIFSFLALLTLIAVPKEEIKQSFQNMDVAQQYKISGNEKYSAGNYDGALKDYEKVLSLIPEAPYTHYQIACIYSMKNNSKEGFYQLSKAVKGGFKDFNLLETVPELKFLRDQPEFSRFVNNGYQLPEFDSTLKNNKVISDPSDTISKLERLAQLKEKGMLTEKEFEEQKRKLLAG